MVSITEESIWTGGNLRSFNDRGVKIALVLCSTHDLNHGQYTNGLGGGDDAVKFLGPPLASNDALNSDITMCVKEAKKDVMGYWGVREERVCVGDVRNKRVPFFAYFVKIRTACPMCNLV